MKKLCSVSLILAMVASLLPAGVSAADEDDNDTAPEAQAVVAPDPAWPVKFEVGGADYVIYPPQLDTWEGNRLEGRSAVAVTPAGAESPEFGVAWIGAQTSTSSGGEVDVRNFSVGKVDFPTVSGGSAAYADAVRAQLAAKTWQLTQARLEADLEIDKTARKTAAQPVRNDVPQMLFSQTPAILVPIDGTPALRDVPDTNLKRVVNTRALLLLDPAVSRYYLYVSDHWVESSKFEGPWTAVTSPSAQLEQAKQAALKDNQVDLLEPDEEQAKAPQAPAIHVTTTPTELLQTNGPAQYSPVDGTRLLYVTNSPNRIFLDTTTQMHYVLISGRWFRARNLGPTSWEYVTASSLPGDFARIPSTHSQESVRAAVAGTPQAREAAIENSVPQVATVTRSSTHLNVAYDGNPSFVPIEGTALQRAANAPIPVIRLDANSFYALDNGVWFVATSPFGPWAVASTVPAVVYSIPRNSPIHYVTYVRVYDATPDYVYVGYTPGYVGSYVSSDNVVVYGTGWYYRPWIGTVWYSAPITWGFGFSYVNTWWRPWWRPYRPAFWYPPAPCFRPAWGPWYYRPVHRTVVVNNVTVNRVNVRQSNVTNVYNRWDRQAVTRVRAAEPMRAQSGGPDRRRDNAAGPDSGRRDFGERRNDSARGDAARGRNDGNPPAAQAPGRRDDNGPRADRSQGRGELPRIQGQNRRWNADDGQDGRRDGERAQGRRGDNGGPADLADRSSGRDNLPPIQGQNRRWNVGDAQANRRDGDNRNDRSPAAGAPQGNRSVPQANAQSRPQVQEPDRRDTTRQDTVRQDPARQELSRQDTVRQDRREWSSQNRRDFGGNDGNRSQQRRDSQAQPQGIPERRAASPQTQAPQVQAPRVQAAPQVQAPRMQSAPQVRAPRMQQGPQAQAPRMQQRGAPEGRAAAPQSRPRIERNMEGRAARGENRGGGGGGGGQREFRAGGGGFRADR